MKTKKTSEKNASNSSFNFNDIKSALTRDEMKEIKGGSGGTLGDWCGWYDALCAPGYHCANQLCWPN